MAKRSSEEYAARRLEATSIAIADMVLGHEQARQEEKRRAEARKTDLARHDLKLVRKFTRKKNTQDR